MEITAVAFQKGNKFWQWRAKSGPNYKYEGEEGCRQLEEECQAYLAWCEKNPLMEAKVVAYKGKAKIVNVPKMRVATVNGFCLHLGIYGSTWADWRKRPDLCEVIAGIEESIREYKFAGAAADLLNANIISRDLGLADRSEVSGPGGGPIKTDVGGMSAQEAAEAYANAREGKG